MLPPHHSPRRRKPACQGCTAGPSLRPLPSHTPRQASEDLQLRVWDVRSMARPAEVIKAAHNNVMTCCDVAPDTLTFLSSSNGFDGAGCELKVWDRRMGKMLCDLRGHTQTVSSCAYLPSAASAQPSAMPLVVSASSDTTMRTWDPSQARSRQLPQPPRSASPPQVRLVYEVSAGPVEEF